jgi:hypothetical protein
MCRRISLPANVASLEIDLWHGESMWPVAILAFGLAAPEKTIHYRGNFREDGNGAMFRNQKELSIGGRAGDYLQDVGEALGKQKASRLRKSAGRLASEITDGRPRL